MNDAGVQWEQAYPQRLHHHTPSWVPDVEIFHIRIRISSQQTEPLTSPNLGQRLLQSVATYHGNLRWYCHLCLLMPDHLHALISFSRDTKMSRIVGEWKSHHSRANSVLWQDNFFDHRLRNQAGHLEKHLYILNNPVAKGLCANAADWPWVFPASDPRVERAVPAR